MLRAAAGTAERESGAEADQAARGTGERVAARAEQRAEHQDGAGAEAVRETAGRHLQRSQRTVVEAAQQREGGEAQPELLLPDRQEHVDQVRIAVVQGMIDAGRHQRAPCSLCRGGIEGRVSVRCRRHSASRFASMTGSGPRTRLISGPMGSCPIPSGRRTPLRMRGRAGASPARGTDRGRVSRQSGWGETGSGSARPVARVARETVLLGS